MATRTAYQNFIEPLETKATARLYNIGLHRFLEFTKAKDYDELLTMGTTDNIADFIQHLKNGGKHPRTIRSYLTGVKHFYVMNDTTTINWDKMRKFLGKVQNKNHDELYSKEQLQKVMDAATERERIAFLLMLSAGLRVGALPDIKVGDLAKIDGLYKVKVYAGTGSEYVAFCTPECARAIDTYLAQRTRKGETITPESPLLSKLGDTPGALKLNSMISLLNRVLMDSGVRLEGDTKYKRQKVARFHSLRKHYNTCLAKAGVKPALKEVLMGHYIGLESSYLRPTDDELLAEYLKAVDLLTISQEKQLLKEVEKLQTKVAGVEDLKVIVMRQREEIERLKAERKIDTRSDEYIVSKLVLEVGDLRKQIQAMEGKPEPPKMTDEEFNKMLDDENMREYGTTDLGKIKEILRQQKEAQIDRELRWEKEHPDNKE